MLDAPIKTPAQVVLGREGIDALIATLRERGFEVLGPTVRDGAIVYDEIECSSDLPVGLTDIQDGGTYRLVPRDDEALFGYSLGPHSWKKYLFPPRLTLFRAEASGDGFDVTDTRHEVQKRALFGARSCELKAIAVQDRVFMGGKHVEPDYAQRRENLFIVAVNCGHAGGTCFCVSMGTGPRAESGFDIALTEIVDGDQHYFLAEAGSEQGEEILERVPGRPADDMALAAAAAVVERTAAHMGRQMNTAGLPRLLNRSFDSSRWEEIANRCLSCGNCTMVCPTCFCNTVEDVSDLEGKETARVRRWDSCFSVDFSYIHGGSVRVSPRSRYRQWMTHKLSSWWEQFDTSGCVGCGRCITWCPVGIDITEEVAEFRLVDLALLKKGADDGVS